VEWVMRASSARHAEDATDGAPSWTCDRGNAPR
jgi:hypothetical protein